MSEQKNWQEFNPFNSWKQFQDEWMAKFSKTAGDFVASEHFSKMLGKYLDVYLETSKPLRKHFHSFMEKSLQQMSMPTRNDFVSIAERVTNLEVRLDDLDAKSDEILSKLAVVEALLKPQPESEAQAKTEVEDNG